MYVNDSLYGLWDRILSARSHRLLQGIVGDDGQGGA
jgi:hypothetical protein